MGAKKATETTFPHPKKDVFDALLRAVPQVKGMKVKSSDEASGQIVARTGVSLRSWGENVPIQVIDAGPNETKVEFRSASKMALVDWGKNQANIDRLLAAMEAELKS